MFASHLGAAIAVAIVSGGVSLAQDSQCDPQEMFGRLLIGANVNRAIVTDFTNDGRPDILAADTSGPSIRVWVAIGDGQFESGAFLLPTSPADSLRVDDLTGDGHPDLVAAAGTDSSVALFAGDGAGGFTEVGFIQVDAFGPIATGRFGAARSIHVIVASSASAELTVLAVSPSGTLTQEFGVALPDPAKDVQVGDVNDDELLDIVVLTTSQLVVLPGHADGAFGEPVQSDVQVSFPRSLLLEDLNGDGLLDSVTTAPSSDALAVQLGAGDFVLEAAGVFDGVDGWSIESGDLNNDEAIDLVVWRNTSLHDVFVMFNDGNADFEVVPILDDLDAETLDLADFNGDGVLDLGYTIRDVWVEDEFHVRFGDGSGGFERDSTELPSSTNTIDAADFDGDGRVDVVTAHPEGLYLWRGDGDGTFLEPVTFATSAYHELEAIDLDGDGLDEVVTVQRVGSPVMEVHWNQGGTFTPLLLEVPGILASWSHGDVDADGDIDLIGTPYVGGAYRVALWRTLDDQMFAPVEILPLDTDPRELAIGDMNGDDVPDVVVIGPNGPEVFVANGNGTYTGTGLHEWGGGGDPRLADVDADGDLDLMTIWGAWVMVWFANGDGTLTGDWEPADLPGDQVRQFELLDVDDDGIEDLVTMHSSDNRISIGIGYGNGMFLGRATHTASDYVRRLAIGDLDGSGSPDIVMVMEDVDGDVIDAWLNECRRCAADLEADDEVAFGDLLLLLSAWGTGGPGADLANPIDTVDFADLLILLSAWGPCTE